MKTFIAVWAAWVITCFILDALIHLSIPVALMLGSLGIMTAEYADERMKNRK